MNIHFSDEVFQTILRCVQGELDFCKEINMSKWQQSADKDITTLSKHAKHEADKEDHQKKEAAMQRINKVIERKSEQTNAERKMEHQIQIESNKLTDRIVNDPNLDPHQKQETIHQVKEQVRRAIEEIHHKTRNFTPGEEKLMLDMHASQNQ